MPARLPVLVTRTLAVSRVPAATESVAVSSDQSESSKLV